SSHHGVRFMIPHIMGAHQFTRDLVVEVLPLPPHRLVCLGAQDNGLSSAVTALLATTHAPLAFRPMGLCLAGATWREEARPIPERGKGRYSEGYSRLPARRR